MEMVVEAVHSRKAEEVVQVRLKTAIEEVLGHLTKVKEAAVVHCLLLVVAV